MPATLSSQAAIGTTFWSSTFAETAAMVGTLNRIFDETDHLRQCIVKKDHI
jgi:hypothetical protein